jgi:cardiolipin synthase
MFIVGILILIQMSILTLVVLKLIDQFFYVYIAFTLISLCAVMYILGRRDNPSYKLAWIIPILLFPVFGGLFYVLFGANKMNKRFKFRVKEVYDETCYLSKSNQFLLEEIEKKDKSIFNQVKYIEQHSTYPIFKNTTVEYLSIGEIYFERLKEELKKAKHFILMEYFIIEEGKMWGEILEILVKKVQQGVEVRLMYDDAGTIQTLPFHYDEKLRTLGIQTVIFNQVQPLLNIKINNRDHRKITVIDGYIGFTGGINLADEYINHRERFGHWKDTGVKLEGEAVWNLTLMFLQGWRFITKETIDYEKYRPHLYHSGPFESDGYVLPFGDSPYDEEIVGENVYLNIINKAKTMFISLRHI